MKLSVESFQKVFETVMGGRRIVTGEDLTKIMELVGICQAEAKSGSRRSGKAAN